MAQAFVTTYQNHFRGHTQPLRKSKRPVDRHCISAPPGDYWREPSVEQKIDLNLPLAEALINQTRRRLYWSTYQVNYCRDMVKETDREMKELVKKAEKVKTDEVEEHDMENELLRYCKELYGKKSSKLLPPTETQRRINGYMRPETMYTPLTHYQMEYGKVGYDIMSDPMHYLDIHKEKEENKNIPECTAENILKMKTLRALKQCEDMKMKSEDEGRAERERKLKVIMDNLDSFSNHVNTTDTDINFPCQFIV